MALKSSHPFNPDARFVSLGVPWSTSVSHSSDDPTVWTVSVHRTDYVTEALPRVSDTGPVHPLHGQQFGSLNDARRAQFEAGLIAEWHNPNPDEIEKPSAYSIDHTGRVRRVADLFEPDEKQARVFAGYEVLRHEIRRIRAASEGWGNEQTAAARVSRAGLDLADLRLSRIYNDSARTFANLELAATDLDRAIAYQDSQDDHGQHRRDVSRIFEDAAASIRAQILEGDVSGAPTVLPRDLRFAPMGA